MTADGPVLLEANPDFGVELAQISMSRPLGERSTRRSISSISRRQEEPSEVTVTSQLRYIRASMMKRLAKSAAWAAIGVTERLRDDRAVLLTFDDGPEPGVTEPILERLARFDARAVFFNVGDKVARAGDLLSIVHGAGHRIGNHSYQHPVEVPGDISVVLRTSSDASRRWRRRQGRFPALPTSTRTDTLVEHSAARRLGLSTVLWSVDSRDWQLASRAEAEQRGRELATSVREATSCSSTSTTSMCSTSSIGLLPTLADKGLDLGRGAGQL